MKTRFNYTEYPFRYVLETGEINSFQTGDLYITDKQLCPLTPYLPTGHMQLVLHGGPNTAYDWMSAHLILQIIDCRTAEIIYSKENTMSGTNHFITNWAEKYL